MRRFLSAVCLAAILLAVAPWAVSAEMTQTKLSPEEAARRQTEFLVKPLPDLSIVYIARFAIDGKTVDVTSLSPSILARAAYKNGPAISAARFDKTRTSIEFLSRDPATGGGASLMLPLDKPGIEFTFPLVQEGGLHPAKLKLLSLTHNP